MGIEIKIRPATRMEAMYTYIQSTQLRAQTGSVGYLEAKRDITGKGFYSSWVTHRDDLRTEQFKEEFEQVLDRLRFGAEAKEGDGFLENRTTLTAYCKFQPAAKMNTASANYGFRVETESFVYMMRVNPFDDTFNLHCFCYRRDWLEQHLRNAERGIRFVDGNYNDLFRIPDGGMVRVTYADGEVKDVTCRYIDEYHLEFGFGNCNLFHIYELAEKMEKNGHRLEPVDAVPGSGKKGERR